MPACPHCHVPDGGAGSFCTHCGMALPNDSEPRIIRGGNLASTAGGRELQIKDLARRARGAIIPLVAISLFQFAIGALFIALGANSSDALSRQGYEAPDLTVLGIGMIVFGAIYAVFALWAKWSPLPAAITGLTLYATVLCVDTILDPRNLMNGFIIKAIIIVALVKAISAGLKHRALKREMANG